MTDEQVEVVAHILEVTLGTHCSSCEHQLPYDPDDLARAIIAAYRPLVIEECAKVAEGFSRMKDKPDHADAPKLVAHALRSMKEQGDG